MTFKPASSLSLTGHGVPRARAGVLLALSALALAACAGAQPSAPTIFGVVQPHTQIAVVATPEQTASAR